MMIFIEKSQLWSIQICGHSSLDAWNALPMANKTCKTLKSQNLNFCWLLMLNLAFV